MMDGARLEDLSLLQEGAIIPEGQTWAGSPAKPLTGPHQSLPPQPSSGKIRRAMIPLAYSTLVLVLPGFLLAALMPGVVLLARINFLVSPLYLLAIPLLGASFVILVMLEVL